MKLPNGYGSVYKLPGNRRKPWAIRKTISWEIDEKGDKLKRKYQYIGYYETKEEALNALAIYNSNPYDINNDITFAEIYDKWSAEKFETISHSNVNGYKASYAVCKNLYSMKFIEIRKTHLQGVIDTCGKNYPTLRKLRVLFNQLYQFAMENDLCQKDYSKFVDIVKHKEKGKEEKHKPFTESEIQTLWNNVNRNEYIQIYLILIYSGVRISELLDLKKQDVHLEERYFDVIASKTESGIRKVPISKKVLPFFEKWMQKEGCDYLVCTPEGKHFTYRNYFDSYWKPLMQEMELQHLPHDTRHTTISLLAKAEVNQTIIKRIVGHAGAMSLTEKVYTHFDIQQLVEAIDLI